jgi:23S rRNA pseudouridine1911/1915/1917 synthase
MAEREFKSLKDYNTYRIDQPWEGFAVEDFLKKKLMLSRRSIIRLKKSMGIHLNGVNVRVNSKLMEGDLLELYFDPEESENILPEEMELDIVFEDEYLIVINKPPGIPVHPSRNHYMGTLSNGLMYYWMGEGAKIKIRPVNRLDKDTSGLLLVAKNDFSHQALSEQIKAHTVERAYKAIVYGNLREDSGFVDGPIGRHPTDRKRMAIVPGGRSAHTDWRVLERLRGSTLIEAKLTTGRTHQIRVHMASIGHPVVGDPVYGPKKPPIDVQGGQLLHAFRIGFTHPTTGERMLFEAPPEKRFTDMLEKLSI